jgi:hypothetical protein
MNTKRGPFNPNSLLWWVAIIALIVSGVLYHLLGQQAEVDVNLRQQRVLVLVVGIVIAGICLIIGTASRWFYPK